jgi:RimJ/RimL family protein N-acetyltransferase
LPRGLNIRPATVADAPAIIAGINAVCAEEAYLQTDRFVSNPQWDAALYRPETVPDHLILVADLHGKVVGSVNVFPGPCGPKDRHTADLGIHVLFEYRNQGIGTRLLETALTWARARSIEKITLSVFSTNACAIHLYENLGFQREGTRRKQFRVRGEYVDDILMAKFL